MDFFEAQDTARRRTRVLIALFVLAVLVIIAVVYAVLHFAIGPGVADPLDPALLLQAALGVGLVVGAGTAIRTASLRQGGPAVAELLGGRRIASDTTDPAERRLVHVVEEMAIASGMPVPAIYVLDREDGINAFAAGYSTHDAAVAVTRGALDSLTRDELQGVMAHEFSHILNGDMRLNIRLIGVLYGILLLAVIGRGIVYAGPRGGGRRGRDGGAGWIVLLGLALLLVGYIGVFFGKLIKAAVSRQREYLADSAAVQFTRNPSGLAGALKKIAAQAQGSRVHDHHAEELSHLFFANGLRSTFFGFLATHPPLETRIRRLEPDWQGELGRPAAASPAALHAAAASRHGFEAVGAAGLAGTAAAPAAMVASVGAPTPEHLAYAAALLERFPPSLARAAHRPADAEALILALVLADSEDPQARQPIRDYDGPELEARVRELVPEVRAQGPDARLPLLDIALPALLRLSPSQAHRFYDAVERLVHADETVRPFEYALLHTLRRRLQLGRSEPSRASGARSFEPLRDEVQALLSAVAWAGSRGDRAAAAAAFSAGVARLPSSIGRIALQQPDSIDPTRMDHALSALETASPAVRRRFLEACADCAAYDRRLIAAEAELLRAIAESLDCPMPPLLAVSEPVVGSGE